MTTPNKKNKEALGKGIRSLLESINNDLKTGAGDLKNTVVEAATGMLRIPLDQIETNPRQPRHDFDESALNELAASIVIHDISLSRLPGCQQASTGLFRVKGGSGLQK